MILIVRLRFGLVEARWSEVVCSGSAAAGALEL